MIIHSEKGKLWDKWFQSSETASNVDTCEDGELLFYNTKNDETNSANIDSDQEDWEGETHVSRILREYHQTKHQALPEWLINDGLPASSLTRGSALYKPRSHKLWEVDVKMTPRERDRLALRHDEQARRKSENNVQSRMKAKDHSYNLNMIRKTHTFQSSIL
jgi:hypothetical protein